ncbi:hypothetical protein HanXRQr2_Chr13g0573651 [Helianthus annuus]|uniref:Uncharacterized protein n=1 Tax=Helianthus annuus TaxID=4232 RepID=A0A9K3EFB8_HELAN|nr:hypothetical protein HanXRQr2_Chr13g0573651 [Helianthus annuus]KAJ0848019.1 hypothetical protein HanPSC8_Chr13g0552261 [Helianthus annuus]
MSGRVKACFSDYKGKTYLLSDYTAQKSAIFVIYNIIGEHNRGFQNMNLNLTDCRNVKR